MTHPSEGVLGVWPEEAIENPRRRRGAGDRGRGDGPDQVQAGRGEGEGEGHQEVVPRRGQHVLPPPGRPQQPYH